MYSTPVTIIKSVVRAFGIQQDNLNRKLLNTHMKDLHFSYVKIDALIESTTQNIGKFIDDKELGSLINTHLHAFIKDYLFIVGHFPRGTKESTLKLSALVEYRMKEFLIATKFDGHILNKITNTQSSVSLILEGVKSEGKKIKNDPEWQNKIHTWKTGKHQPSVQQIKLLSQQFSKNPTKLKRDLLISRAIDYFYPFWKQYISQNTAPKDHNKIHQLIDYVSTTLDKKSKTSISKDTSKKAIKKLEKIISINNDHSNLRYLVYFLDALWHVLYVGDLEKACNLYNKAFDKCLYCAGAMQETIIEHALVVAVHQSKIDNVFLKKLRNAQITFDYDVPINYKNNNKKLKITDVIQDWQIEILKQEFHHFFPNEMLFSGVSYSQKKDRTGPVIYDINNIPKPDYKSLNRTIKVGEWDKKIPQLVWFTQLKKNNYVKTLLEKGASVDKLSESNESAIGMALEGASVMSPVQPNTSLFKLISTYLHKEKTLNTRTNKKKSLPIILAVETGNPNIVKKILYMGADPNKLGSTDEVTALYTCLIYIDAIKSGNPGKYLSQSRQYNFPETVDSRKRYGVETMPLEGEKKLKTLIELTSENIKKYLSIGRLRQIARILLDNDANPNQEVVHPIKKGLTPLAVAVEINEVKLVRKMINEYKGNINTTVSLVANPTDKVDLIQIAEIFKSKETLQLLINMQHR